MGQHVRASAACAASAGLGTATALQLTSNCSHSRQRTALGRAVGGWLIDRWAWLCASLRRVLQMFRVVFNTVFIWSINTELW